MWRLSGSGHQETPERRSPVKKQMKCASQPLPKLLSQPFYQSSWPGTEFPSWPFDKVDLTQKRKTSDYVWHCPSTGKRNRAISHSCTRGNWDRASHTSPHSTARQTFLLITEPDPRNSTWAWKQFLKTRNNPTLKTTNPKTHPPPTALKRREATTAPIQMKAVLKNNRVYSTFPQPIPRAWDEPWQIFLTPSDLSCGSSASAHAHPHTADTAPRAHQPALSKSRYLSKSTHKYPKKPAVVSFEMPALKCTYRNKATNMKR